jgi:hypothetical protein
VDTIIKFRLDSSAKARYTQRALQAGFRSLSKWLRALAERETATDKPLSAPKTNEEKSQ